MWKVDPNANYKRVAEKYDAAAMATAKREERLALIQSKSDQSAAEKAAASSQKSSNATAGRRPPTPKEAMSNTEYMRMRERKEAEALRECRRDDFAQLTDAKAARRGRLAASAAEPPPKAPLPIRLSKPNEPPKPKAPEDFGPVVPIVTFGTSVSEELYDFAECFLPMAENSELGKALRKKGFKLADPNGNGLCSLAELEKFVMQTLMAAYPKDVKQKDHRGNPLEKGRDLFDAFRPSYIRAYQDAKDFKADTGKVLEGTKKSTADDFVSKGEFRYFCAYLVIYGCMFDAFAKIDGGGAGRDANDDRRIELHEWMEGWRGVTDHGLVAFAAIADDAAAKAVFAAMDDNGGGVVLLDEWCTFIKDAEVKAGTEAGKLLAADEAGGVGVDKSTPQAAALAGVAAAAANGGSKKKKVVEVVEVVDVDTAGSLYDFIVCFEPMAEESDLGKALRKKGFKLGDPNGNGLCSLAELETFVLKTLMEAYPKDMKKLDHRGDPLEKGRDLFTAFRPSYIRAFNDAKDYKKDDGKVLAGTKKATNDDFVSKGEFRYFCAYLCIYARMFDAFAQIDGGSAGRDANDDRRIELHEWLAGYLGVGSHGLVAFAGIEDDARATEVFAEMDGNGGGVVLLDEWCEYAKAKEVAAGTDMGKLLTADEAGGVGVDKSTPAKAKAAAAAAATDLGGGAAAMPPAPPPVRGAKASAAAAKAVKASVKASGP